MIGSLFASHGEDRLIVAPADIPPLLTDTLKAVEDRRFDSHFGVDPIAVMRALFVNVSAGEIREGASTLTQQLVRSYFLTNPQRLRGLVAASSAKHVMAVALELRYSKSELLHAYVNEIYLGQDGARAIHGFGLASQFYFGKPLAELELHELALLVAEVRGPTYYDPRRHADRALERRNFVLQRMADEGLASNDAVQEAAEQKLGLVGNDRRGTTHSAFLGLVRRQLSADYARDDLERTGLIVLSTLDPAVQAAAERALDIGIEGARQECGGVRRRRRRDEPAHGRGAERSSAAATRAYEGFNRALDARRPIGSLIKPAVFLAALESGRYSLASVIDDAPIVVELDKRNTWTPSNFDDQAHGLVPLVRALAESYNMATVRLGLDVGLEPIADTLQRLGLTAEAHAVPSMLLGALALTPIEVAQIYNTLANGGFRVPLRAVRSVVGEDGELLQRYEIEITQAADAGAVYASEPGARPGHGARHGPHGARAVAGRHRGRRQDGHVRRPARQLVRRVHELSFDRHLARRRRQSPIGLTGSTGAAKIWAGVLADDRSELL